MPEAVFFIPKEKVNTFKLFWSDFGDILILFGDILTAVPRQISVFFPSSFSIYKF